jgi:hypothetical protein
MKVAQKLDPNSTIEEIKQKIINDPKYKGKRLLWQ